MEITAQVNWSNLFASNSLEINKHLKELSSSIHFYTASDKSHISTQNKATGDSCDSSQRSQIRIHKINTSGYKEHFLRYVWYR